MAPALLALALIPARGSVGLPGALFAAQLGVVATAVVGGVGPAALAMVVGVLAADFFFAAPYYSLRVNHLIDLIALTAFAVTAAVIGVLVDVLTVRGLQVAGMHAEAEGLTRLAAEALNATPAATPRRVDTIRRTFGLEAVALLRRVDDAWSVECSSSSSRPPVGRITTRA